MFYAIVVILSLQSSPKSSEECSVTIELSEINLAGQVAIVTGSGRGLGRVMAQTLAASGAAVAVVGRSASHLDETVKAIEKANGRAMAFVADVTDWLAVEQMAQQVEQQFGPVDILVNNAGVVGVPGPVWESDPDAWWDVMDVNVKGVFLCSQAVLPGMVRRRQGRIINVSSLAGAIPIAFGSAYCVSKAALLHFTNCLAAEVKEHDLAVFAMSPGTVRSDMTDYLISSDEGQKWMPWFADIFAEGRDLPPEAGANLVAFLASGAADALSGRFIQASDDVVDMVRRTDDIQRDDLHALRLRL
jgi:NAD(P)-dependent dehydrogenase (short-subunit alcohol dehydrogenase family)